MLKIVQIAASISEFGFNNPILVDTNAGIIAGHGRLLAARKLQLKEVPVIVLDHLTDVTEARLHHRAGRLDLQGLCLALADWSSELNLLRSGQKNRRGNAPAAERRQSGIDQPLIE
jgi:hypothetical protein